MEPGIYICRDEDGMFLAERIQDGIWQVFGVSQAVSIVADEIMAGPFTMKQILERMTGRKIP